MAIRAWTLIPIFCVFDGPAEEGGVSSGYKRIGASGSGIARMWP